MFYWPRTPGLVCLDFDVNGSLKHAVYIVRDVHLTWIMRTPCFAFKQISFN